VFLFEWKIDLCPLYRLSFKGAPRFIHFIWKSSGGGRVGEREQVVVFPGTKACVIQTVTGCRIQLVNVVRTLEKDGIKKRGCRIDRLWIGTFEFIPLEDDCLLGCCTVQSGRSFPTFQRCFLPPSSGRVSRARGLRYGNQSDKVERWPDQWEEGEGWVIVNTLWIFYIIVTNVLQLHVACAFLF
jgi:hypothetical protein